MPSSTPIPISAVPPVPASSLKKALGPLGKCPVAQGLLEVGSGHRRSELQPLSKAKLPYHWTEEAQQLLPAELIDSCQSHLVPTCMAQPLPYGPGFVHDTLKLLGRESFMLRSYFTTYYRCFDYLIGWRRRLSSFFCIFSALSNVGLMC